MMPQRQTDKLKISVVMATYNRADILPVTIDHLARQTLAPASYEVIIVDDGSTDGTQQVVEQKSQQAPFRLTYLHHTNRGPGYTQNRGIREAQAPLVLLMADDIFLSAHGLQAHLDCHAQHPAEEAAVLGQVVQSPELEQSVFLRHWNPFRFSDFDGCEELPYYMFWACNISFKKAFMTAHGMFRDRMGPAGPAAHEDAELGCRLHQHGLRIYYDKEAVGYHHHVETLEGTIRRSYQRGQNWREFYGQVHQPELAIRYRTYNLGFLIRQFRSLTGPRAKYLVGKDKSVASLIYRYLMRLLVFNRLTVPYLWQPLLRHAEHSRFTARFMHDRYYRGVIVYYFLQGCRDESRLGTRPQPLCGSTAA